MYFLAQINTPPVGFEDCIRKHFIYKKKYIFSVCSKWLREAETSDTPGHLKLLNDAILELEDAYKKLENLTQQTFPSINSEVKEPASEPVNIFADKSVEEKMRNEIAFLKDIHPDVAESVFEDVLKQTAKKNESNQIIETNFHAAVELLSSLIG